MCNISERIKKFKSYSNYDKGIIVSSEVINIIADEKFLETLNFAVESNIFISHRGRKIRKRRISYKQSKRKYVSTEVERDAVQRKIRTSD